MRYRTILTLALILGLVPALNTAPLLAMQDDAATLSGASPRKVTGGEETFEFKLDCDSDFSEGLEVAASPR